RDTRDVIIDHIIDDLNFAYENMTQKPAPWNASTVTKWIPMAYKARVLLYEASWRKYHAGTDFVKGCDKYTPEQLFQMAADAAKEVIEKGPYKLYTTGTYANGAGGAFRKLFTEDNAVTTEVMLAQVYDEELAYRGAQNYYYNRQATTVRQSFSRKFMNSFLNKDGSPYSELDANGKYKLFKEETTDRDPRLNMSIRAWDYKMKDASGALVFTAAPFQNHTVTGYHPTKIVADDATVGSSQDNVNDYPLMRFAEVLLNYAEAMAELGKMDDAVWTQTIGALRKRAGITGGTTATGTLTQAPSGTPDPYIAAYYPGISDPKILEVRRERACELALEGFRPDDLKRWRMGDLFVNDPWEGIYFQSLETPIDVNGDGTDDVYFYTGSKPQQTKYKSIAVQLPGTAKDPLACVKLPNNAGYLLKWNLTGREWPERQYLRPIPTTVMRKNPNLEQNPGWKGLE
ncbi:MAG: RagB/SusD family nutrient uptake outer membrane protein, partial [Muribaculaceae bacterium]|nr:RagB/SusD family nutrient uptake outer membrane protein [Muribaculaceae bacterium]